jgi:hypothetical protein
VTFSQRTVIISKCDIQLPMQMVLHLPMIPNELLQRLRGR